MNEQEETWRLAEFECWNVLIDYGRGKGMHSVAMSRYKSDGPKYMLMGQVRVMLIGHVGSSHDTDN